MNKPKRFPLLALAGLFGKGKKFAVKVDIGTQPIAQKHEEHLMSKQKLNRMKGKKARKNRGKNRGNE